MANALTALAATAIILSKSAQSELVAAFQADGNKDALHGLVKANIRLAHKVAKKNVRKGLDFNDLLSCAV